jgi:RNA polymerase sigma-70 factor (ECF subfamily)
LDTVLKRLQGEFQAAGKETLFDALRDQLTGDRGEVTYGQTAGRLGLSEASVKVAVHRMRLRYRELLHEEVAHTVSTPGQVEEELRHLVAALRS